jgi:hypothetical protein
MRGEGEHFTGRLVVLAGQAVREEPDDGLVPDTAAPIGKDEQPFIGA